MAETEAEVLALDCLQLDQYWNMFIILNV